MRAIAYYRFSTIEQRKGNSIDRQRGACRAFVESRGWHWTGEEFIDEGQSAFSGANLSSGKLGDFERLAVGGHYPEGTVLVVERLDRLSRKNIWEATDWLRRIVAAGVGIATVDGSKLYGAGSLIPLGDAFELMLKYSVSNEESAKKSDRLASVFAKKRAMIAEGHVMTGALPAWLRIDAETGQRKIVAIPERVEVVKRIYQMSDDGYGRDAIAKRLNLDGVPTWGHTATGWYKSYVASILRNPAVLGDYQPMTQRVDDPRVAIGEVQRNYFPTVISADQFARLNSKARTAARQNTGIRGRELNNLLSALAKCSNCGATMTMTSKVKAGTVVKRAKIDGGTRSFVRGVDESYLVCDHSQRGQCTNRTRYRYERVIKAVLDAVLHLSMDDSLFSSAAETATLGKRVAELQRDRSDAVTRADNLLEMLSRHPNSTLEAKWAAIDAEAVKLQSDLKDAEAALAEARAAVPAEVHLARVNEVREMIDDINLDTRFVARSKIITALRSTISSLEFNVGINGDQWMFATKGNTHIYSFAKDGTPHIRWVSPFSAASEDQAQVAETIRRRGGIDITSPENVALAKMWTEPREDQDDPGSCP